MKVSRINKGIYNIVKNKKTYQARKCEDSQQWNLFLINNDIIQSEDYIQTYLDFKSCKICVEYYLND